MLKLKITSYTWLVHLNIWIGQGKIELDYHTSCLQLLVKDGALSEDSEIIKYQDIIIFNLQIGENCEFSIIIPIITEKKLLKEP